MNEQERELRTGMAEVYTQAKAITEANPRGLSAEDETRWDALMADYDKRAKQVERLEKLSAADKNIGRSLTEPTRPEIVKAESDKAGKRGINSPEYRKAYTRYLATGEVRAVLPQGTEARALQMDSDVSGGFLVPPQEFSDQVIKFVDDNVFVRQLATKYRVPNAQSLGVPQLVTDIADADWTSELATGGEDSSLAFGKREFRPFPLAKLVKVSNKLIRAAAQLTQFAEDGETESPLSVDGIVIDRLGYKFAIAEEKAFMSGSGSLQPLGLFTASADGVPTSSDFTCASATAIAANDLIDAKYTLKEQYQRSKSTVWLFNKAAIKRIRKLTDSNGQFIWSAGGIGQASLAAGRPDTILDIPFVMSEYVPSTFTTGLYVGLLGDLRFYWIADALDLTVQRLVELYAATNQIGFIGRKETDGMPVLGEAFVRLKLA